MAPDYPVVIVGGGPVGLSTAIFLARHGVHPLLVERHATTAILPGVRVVNPRSMELYRAAGLEAAIRAAPPSVFATRPRSSRRSTVAGPESYRAERPATGVSRAVSPCAPVYIDQDELEPIVRAHAERAGATVRFGTEMVGFAHDGDGVTVRLRERSGGPVRAVRCRYLVAADGHRSGIRQRLGIGLGGPGTLVHVVTVVFDADIDRLLADGRVGLCYLDSPEPGTLLTPFNRAGGWVLMVPYHPERGESADDFDAARCQAVVRAAVGVPDLSVDVVSPVADDPRQVLAWEIASRMADRYRAGRVFLVGDAAHVMPPAGGFGANTGIQDGHNLAWKLALVLAGTAGPALLDSYETERRPVAVGTCAESARQMRERTERTGSGTTGHDQLAISLGYSYRSAAVAANGSGPAPAFRPPADLRAEPGTRSPHLPLRRAGTGISSLDLLGDTTVVLAGPDGSAWAGAARTVGERLGVPVRCIVVGVDVEDPTGQWCDRHGVGPSGAVLVRPDGIVGWRRRDLPADPDAELYRALRAILAR